MMTTRCNLFYDDHCAGLVLKWFWSPMQQSGDPLFGFQWNHTHNTLKDDEKKVFNFPLKNLVVLWLAVRNGGTFKSIQWTGGNFSLSCILTEGGRRRRISNTSILPNTKEYLTEHRAKIRIIKLQRKQEFSLLCYWWFWISDKFLGTLNILLSKSSVLLSCFLKRKNVEFC